MDGAGPLAALLSHVGPSSHQASLDFSSLDAATFATLNEACAQMLQLKGQDSDLRLSLAAKNKELETKLERLQSDRERARAAADVAQRNEEAVRAVCAQAKAQLDESEASRKQVLQDLAQSRRESQAVKAASRQQKQSAERSIARQRERFTDSGISAARSQTQECIILPGVFAAGGDNGQSATEPESLERRQIAELESQRLALLSSNAALRRLFSDALNCFSQAASSIGASCSSNYVQSDLFPQGEPLRKDYVLSSKEGNHPAVRALSAMHQASEKAAAQLAYRKSAETSDKQQSTNQPPAGEDPTASAAARRALESQVHTLKDRIRNQESELSSIRASVESMRIQLVQAETRAAEAEVRSMRGDAGADAEHRPPTHTRAKRSWTPEPLPREENGGIDINAEQEESSDREPTKSSTGANSSSSSSFTTVASTSSNNTSNDDNGKSEKRRRMESTGTTKAAQPQRSVLTARRVPNQSVSANRATSTSRQTEPARRVVSLENTATTTTATRKPSSGTVSTAKTKPIATAVKPASNQSALQEALEKRRKAAQSVTGSR